MDRFPWVPQHEQPVVSDEEASEAARVLANPKSVASKAGRALAAHQHQDEQKETAEEVVPDPVEESIPTPVLFPNQEGEVADPKPVSEEEALDSVERSLPTPNQDPEQEEVAVDPKPFTKKAARKVHAVKAKRAPR